MRFSTDERRRATAASSAGSTVATVLPVVAAAALASASFVKESRRAARFCTTATIAPLASASCACRVDRRLSPAAQTPIPHPNLRRASKTCGVCLYSKNATKHRQYKYFLWAECVCRLTSIFGQLPSQTIQKQKPSESPAVDKGVALQQQNTATVLPLYGVQLSLSSP